jgi:putative transposase
MPRKARIDAPGALHHIICRGIEKRNIFRTAKDRNDLIERLATVLSETQTPCYAWALLPNHFHLLLRTGSVPLSIVMRRLLTGYVVSFNLRHRRHGHLFQNRYKSILCQDDAYLLELVRYIHLNPLRIGLVKSLEGLAGYPYTGHSVLLGNWIRDWQDVDAVLGLFGKRSSSARKRYCAFVEKGIAMGRRSELTGGGLIRSAGGWKAFRSSHRSRVHLKGDERILGDSDFVQAVLEAQNERFERSYQLQSLGYDFEKVLERVAQVFDLQSQDIVSSNKQPQRVKARSVLCYWAVKELDMRGTDVGRLLGLGQPAVSRAAARGGKLVRDMKLSLIQE